MWHVNVFNQLPYGVCVFSSGLDMPFHTDIKKNGSCHKSNAVSLRKEII